MKPITYLFAVYALLLCSHTVGAEVEKDVKTEQTTESPIADMALLDVKVDNMKTDTAKGEAVPLDSQQHTIGDFTIHPLIALKPRVPEAVGKQADASSTTPSPWQLFGFNAGQGLGSQVSSLAGSVTGWLGNRIQLPGLVDTPVRESSTTTSTTTTPRPEVVVRVKQRGSTKKPLISIKGDDERPYRRKTKRPNRFNQIEDSEEDFYDDEEEHNFNNQRKRYQNNFDDDDDDDEEEEEEENEEEEDDEHNNAHGEEDDDEENTEEDDDEEEEEKPVKQNNNKNRRRNPRPLSQNNNNRRRNYSQNQQQEQQESEEVAQYDEDDDDEAEDQNDFYYNKNQASKRSQTEQNFIQRGQQTLLKQIKQFTGGQTPAEIGQKVRKSQKSATKKRRNQATLIIKRNGQAIYVAPELLQITDTANAPQQISFTSTTKVKKPSSHYPQPPLTVPYRRKGKPTQYITIPWSQLGISPPDQLSALSDGVQSQPLILNIPQTAIDSLQYPKPGKKKPAVTPDAVPLLAEASIMDIFKPPRIPPARTPSSTKPSKKVNASFSTGTPVVIATKTKNGPARIRPATIVEKAPAEDNNRDDKMSSEEVLDDEASSQVIVIGDESGETHEMSRHAYKQILDYFNSRIGRQLKKDEPMDASLQKLQNLQNHEQLIPTKVISAEETLSETPKIDDKMDAVTEIPMETQNQAITEEMTEGAVENATESPINI